MKLISPAFLALVLAAATALGTVPPVPGLPPHYVLECAIHDWDGKTVRQYPGKICEFLADGRLLSASQNQLKLYSPKMEVLWSQPYEIHHMMRADGRGRFLYALGSEYSRVLGQLIRYDTVLKINIADGKTAAVFSLKDHYNEIAKHTTKAWRSAGRNTFWHGEPFDREVSHANSIHFGPKDELVVHVNLIGVDLFLDARLKKANRILHRPEKFSEHDVQLLANGNVLSYVNQTGDDQNTSLEEHSPDTKKIAWRFAKPPGTFFSKFGGSVQKFTSGHVLYTDITGGKGKFVLIDKDGREVWTRPPNVATAAGRPPALVGVRALDLTAFLGKNSGV